MNEVHKFLRDKFGEGVDITISVGNRTLRGTMYGDDECFDTDEFYQYFVDEGGNLYKCFYGFDTPLDEIDYTSPFWISDITEDFYC